MKLSEREAGVFSVSPLPLHSAVHHADFFSVF